MYALAKGIYLVRGAKRGAIYDTNTGNVYSINRVACNILLGKTENQEFLNNLREQGLLDNEVVRELDPEALQNLRQTFRLRFIWFEIVSDDCNQRCVHCYAESAPPLYCEQMGLPCASKHSVAMVDKKLTADEWKALMNEGTELGCTQCQFIGGEPFLYKGEQGGGVLDLAAYAKRVGYTGVEIFTNATLLTEKKVKRIKNLDLRIATSLYSIDPEIHDAITRTPGSLRKTMYALELLKKFDVPTRIATILMSINQDTVAATQRWIKEMGFKHRSPDPIRPSGRGDNPLLFPSGEFIARYGLKLRPNFKVDLNTFSRYFSGHSCLAGKITITDTGNALPCVFSRNQRVGNIITAGSLGRIVASDILQRVWHTTKDNVLVCQDCEYRYACRDCRPLSEGTTDGKGNYFTAPYPRCTYNPYTGKWAGGLWKLDKDGKPFYDKSLEPTIEQVTEKGGGKDGRGNE